MAVNAKALFESVRYAPLWSGTSGIYANLSNYPKVEYYVKCPKCGNVHGDYASMKAAHLARLCKVCELEKTNKLKDWIHDIVHPETPEPGKKPKKLKTVQQVIGVKENLDPDPGELAHDLDLDWTGDAMRELARIGPVTRLGEYEEDPDEFETTAGTVYRDEDTAKRRIYAKTIERIHDDPNAFSTDLIRRFVDTEKLSRLIRMDVREFDDPWEYLSDVFGAENANAEAIRIAGINAEAAAAFALTSAGFPHQLDATYLPSGAVVVPR